MYLGWFDDNPKKTASLKIEEAIDAYVRRFHSKPNVVIVNEADRTLFEGVQVRSASYMQRNMFWIGWENVVKA